MSEGGREGERERERDMVVDSSFKASADSPSLALGALDMLGLCRPSGSRRSRGCLRCAASTSSESSRSIQTPSYQAGSLPCPGASGGNS